MPDPLWLLGQEAISQKAQSLNLRIQELQKGHPQELGKNLRVPMIRLGEMSAEEETLAGEIKKLHREEEIGRPFGPPLPRSGD